MRKKLIAALGALSLVGGLATFLTTAQPANAYSENASCVNRSDFTLCALTTDYGLYDIGAQSGYAINNLLTLSDHPEPEPGDDNTVAIGQVVYRGYYVPGDAGQGTGVLGTLFLPFDQVPDQDASRLGIVAQQGDLTDPTLGRQRYEVVWADLGADPRSNGNLTNDTDLSVTVEHFAYDGPGTAGDYDYVNVGLESFIPEFPGFIGLRFHSLEGCNIQAGALGGAALCSDRAQPSQLVTDFGLAPLSPIFAPLDGQLYNSDGEVITGTGLTLPNQPIPFLPLVPFVLLP